MEKLRTYIIEVYNEKFYSSVDRIEFKASNNKEAIKELKSYINPFDNENSSKYELVLFCGKTDSFIDSIKTNYYS